MIHVDVRKEKDTDIRASGMPREWRPKFYVETSPDGAAWTTQYVCYQHSDQTEDETKARAERIARVFVAGIRFAGAEARGTSGGYGL